MPDARSADEGDFHRFVGARWPGLVRTMVLLGCPAGLAPDVVTDGLSRCRKAWAATVESDDPDVVVHRAVIAAWDERRRGAWWEGLRPASERDWPTPDLTALDRLTSEVRTGLVLRRFAGLDRHQAVSVAGQAAGDDLPPGPDATELRALGENVVVLAPTPDDPAVDTAPWWRHRQGRAVAGLVALALALGGWAWLARPGTEDGDRQPVGLSTVAPQRSANSAEVAWYADDVLHLSNATYVLPPLRDLAVMGAGAVYGDSAGRVVHLADDGVRTLLGTKDPRAPLAASDSLGWVAWVDPAGANPRLLVYDIAQADIISELDLPPSTAGPQEEPDTHPVAIDQQAVYFVTSAGARAWRPTRDPGFVEELELPALVDVSSANRMYQIDNQRIRLDQPFFSVVHDVPGRGGELSADGDYALTRSPEDGSVLVYDTRSGARVDVQPPEDLTVSDVVLAPEGAITYLTVDPEGFATQEGSDSNPQKGELVTCQLDDGSCETLASFAVDSEAPILAR
ncbi:hypothetical protein [Nocardioides dilutus]